MHFPIPSQYKYLLFLPPCHIALLRASSTMLNRSGEDRHLLLPLLLRAKSSVFTLVVSVSCRLWGRYLLSG